ncbi:site-2 protease family protein [Oculatella sp. LEGE 06141]|uniref:site-2 protease family protein n=1 Tax=Oculatella sp. LEGE 06141 TaxID=1828648 RepID=UPI00187FB169|nr:site-2 protease family protein [Oculatella sp. LEGE 06141]MBE9179835.1 site-2 protease family protein [Oculatella sp. LEGE 06141]
MKSGWRIGSLFGIPLLIDSSWFLILAFVTFLYGSAWQTQNWSSTTAWIAGFAMALSLFASVLLHELGHSLVARSQGINVTSITLFLFGGIASIDQESKTPSQAFQVAIAGPGVSFLLFLLLTVISQVLPLPEPISVVINNLAGINLVLAIFNMIPGLPLDGGQVLKAAIWKATGSRLQGVRWAAKFGQLLGWAAIIIGFTLYVSSSFTRIGMLWIALLGWFGVRNASAYSRVTDLQEALVHLNAAAAMGREFRVVDANMTLREFADKYLIERVQSGEYFAASDGRYRGLVVVDDLRQVERSLWETQTLHDIVHPLADIATVTESTPLTEVIEQLEVGSLRRITVLTPAGAVAGVIDRGDVVRSLAEKLNMPISDTVIKRIKEEGAYPPGLQLQAIAKATNESA